MFTRSQDFSCPVGRSCRYSDAAVFSIDGATSFWLGHIARTPPGQITVTDIFSVTGEVYGTNLVGTAVAKEGRTTGWSWNNVSSSCVAEAQGARDRYGNVYDTGRTMLCQSEAPYVSGEGDSGSPVFVMLDASSSTQRNPVALAGLNWGNRSGGFGIFSPWSFVASELSPNWGGNAYLLTH